MMVLILKMVLASACITGIYFLLLAREKSFRFNRWYLLLALVLPLTVPLIEVEVSHLPANSLVQNYAQTLSGWQQTLLTDNSGPNLNPVSPVSGTSFTDILWAVLLLVSALFLIRYMLRVYRLLQLKKNSVRVQRAGRCVALSEDVVQPFSFLSTIYVNRQSFEHEEIPADILLHETAHCEQLHSLDILFGELLLTLTWWNPFQWLLLRSIRQNHEFLADEKVVRTKAGETVSYLQLLLASVRSSAYAPMVAEFNYAFIKKRFTMIQKKTSRLATLYSFTSLLACVLVLACFMSFRYTAVWQQKFTEKRIDTVPAVQPGKSFETYLLDKSFSYTEQGVSAEEMAEYKRIIEKYSAAAKEKNKKWVEISKDDQTRLQNIFGRMSKEQQRGQVIRFIKRPPPFAKNVPTTTQFENFKKAATYGVWLDDKKVANEVLNQYTNSDFAHYSVSKLYGAAKKGRNYTHQVNLMTKKAYEDYLRNARKNANEPMMIMSWRPHVAVVEKTK